MRKWSVITHFPEFIDESPRAYHAVVYVDGWLFMIGGFDGQLYYDKVKKHREQNSRSSGDLNYFNDQFRSENTILKVKGGKDAPECIKSAAMFRLLIWEARSMPAAVLTDNTDSTRPRFTI